MREEHTPGPWDLRRISPQLGGEPIFLISAESTLFLRVQACADGFVFGQNEANAYLIAAAPDLLAACVAMLAAHDGDIEQLVAAHDAMKAAVAKAKGGDR